MANSDSVLYAAISAGAGATTEVVAAVTGKRIRVVSYAVTANTGAGTFVWKSATTAISGVMTIAQNAAVVFPAGVTPILQTTAGEALQITTVTCGIVGHLSYVTVE